MINTQEIRQAIKRRGLKESWIAEQIGLSQPAFSNRITGRSKMTLEDLQNINRVIHLTDEEIKSIVCQEE